MRKLTKMRMTQWPNETRGSQQKRQREKLHTHRHIDTQSNTLIYIYFNLWTTIDNNARLKAQSY